MTEFVLLTGCLVGLYVLGFIKCKAQSNDWMDKKYTDELKGLSILTVIWAHGGARLNIAGLQFIAGIGVALFLICSGFGLEMSYKKNGIKLFWIKRFGRILIPILIIELIYELITRTLAFDNYWNSLKNLRAGGWFIGYIIICYVIYYICKIVVKIIRLNDNIEIALLLTIFLVFFVVECVFPYSADIPFLRARQMLSFPLGVIIAKKKGSIIKALNSRKSPFIAIICIIVGAGFMLVSQLPVINSGNNFMINIASFPTVIMLAIGTMIMMYKLPILLNNKMLLWCGVISYELFLAQSYGLDWMDGSMRGVIVYLASTVLMGVVVHGIGKGIYYMCYIMCNKRSSEEKV